MNHIEQIGSYFNPFNQGFRDASSEFNEKLCTWQKIIAVTAAVFAGFLGLGISSIAAFRFTVEKLSGTDSPVVAQTQSVSQKSFNRDEKPVSSENPPEKTVPHRATLPDLELLSFQTLTSLLSGAEYFSPCKEAAFEYEVYENDAFTAYCTWYDETSQVVNIQLKEEYDRGSDDELITLSLADQNSQCNKAEIVRTIANELENAKADTRIKLKKKYARPLKIIQKFFNGDKGSQHNHSHPVEINGIKMWPRRSRTGRFLLHMTRAAHEPKLTLSLTIKGMIEWVYLNGVKICPQDLEKDETWGPALAQHLRDFLEQYAVNYRQGPFVYMNGFHQILFQSELQVHPAAINELPEHVLSLMGPKQHCRYLNDDLTVSPGIDGGGLSRQLYHDLALHLFDGSPNRKISMTESAVPIMRDPHSDEEKEILRLVGHHLIKSAMLKQVVTIGNVLKPEVYACIKLLVLFNNTLVDESLMSAARLLCDNVEYDFLFEVYNRPRKFTADEVKTLTETLCLVEEGEIPTSLHEIKKFTKTVILDDCRYRNQVLAIHHIVDGMFGIQEIERMIFRRVFDEVMEEIPDEKLCEFVQGIKLDPQGIADRIFTESEDPVVLQKCAWLKEYILDSSEKEIERFLIAVTGSSTVTASTKIEISGAAIPHCTASTCAKTIKVPTIHTDLGSDAREAVSNKQKFLNNFKLIYSESGFDMG